MKKTYLIGALALTLCACSGQPKKEKQQIKPSDTTLVKDNLQPEVPKQVVSKTDISENQSRHNNSETKKEVRKKKNPDGYYDIPYDKKTRNIKVEDLFKNVRYVRLETNKISLVNNIIDKVVYENGITYLANYKSHKFEVLLFNKEGTFLRSICREGEGPEEYQSATSITVDGKGNVLFADRAGKGRIVTYNSDGDFISRINLAGLGLKDLTYLNDSVLLLRGERGFQKDMPREEFQTFNIHTKEVIKNMHPVKYRPYRMWFQEGLTTYQGKAIISSYQSNQILEATEDTIRVKYTLNIGKKMPPADFWEELPSYEAIKKKEKSNKYIGHIPFFAENDRYMFISFMGSLDLDNLRSLALVDKLTGESQTFRWIVLAENLMIDPYVFFWQSNGEIIIPFWPHEIIESENKEFLSQFPDLKEDDNPILLIGELK